MNRRISIILLFIVSIVVLWFICPAVEDKDSHSKGHISSEIVLSLQPEEVIVTPEPTDLWEKRPLFNYYNIKEQRQGLDLSMHIIEVDLSNPYVLVRPVTSHKTLFGYKFLSEMDEEWQAEASINAGFSFSNGLLGGLLSVDSKLYTSASGNFPILFLKGQEAFIDDGKSNIWIEGEDLFFDELYYNRYSEEEGIYIFTREYGNMNRINKRHLNASVSNGQVRGLIVRNESFEIPKDGFLISAIGNEAEERLSKAIKPGMVIEVRQEVLNKLDEVIEYDWGYEGGSWIVRDSQIVAPRADGWVGTLENRVPRTAVGVKADGTLVFVVVDGRQKGLSDGLTLKELGQEMLKLGVKDAINLDGGASSEMIVGGQIVNSPSAGRERMVACGFIIRRKE